MKSHFLYIAAIWAATKFLEWMFNKLLDYSLKQTVTYWKHWFHTSNPFAVSGNASKRARLFAFRLDGRLIR